MTCPVVARVVANALAALDHDALREAVLRYVPSEERRLKVSDTLTEEYGVAEEHAQVIADMSDEVMAELRRRLLMEN